jgi:hypothetical protein
VVDPAYDLVLPCRRPRPAPLVRHGRSGRRGAGSHAAEGVEFSPVEVDEAVGVGARVLHDQPVEARVDELLGDLKVAVPVGAARELAEDVLLTDGGGRGFEV